MTGRMSRGGAASARANYHVRRGLLIFACICFAAAFLSACSGGPAPAPEPIIRTVEVQVPFDDPRCAREAIAELGPEPAYPDTDQALQAAPNVYEQVKLLMAGRAMRAARVAAKTTALAECARPAAQR